MEDHGQYTPERIETIRRLAENHQAHAVVTTEKDAVKLSPENLGVPLWTLVVEMRILEGERELVEKILEAVPAETPTP